MEMSDIEQIVNDLTNARWDAMDEITRLREENARLREAVGLMTTMAPFMEMDVDDPVGMAKTVVVEQEKLFQENARLREAVKAAYYEGWQDNASIDDTEDRLHAEWEHSEARVAIQDGGTDA